MATSFPLTTYPLKSMTGFRDHRMTRATLMSSGAVHMHLLSDDVYRTMQCRFIPMTSAGADALIQYLRSSRVVEFDIAYAGTTYRGYFIGDVETENPDGDVATVSAEFYGRVV